MDAIKGSLKNKLTWLANGASALLVIYVVGLGINTAAAKRMARHDVPVDQAMAAESDKSASNRLLSLEEWKAIKGKDGVVLLDTRTRQAYALGHLRGALNIPANELASRARHELDLDSTLVIYCGFKEKCEKNFAAIGVKTPCTGMAHVLVGEMGFRNVRILAVEESKLLQEGVVFESFAYELRNVALNE